MLTETVRQKLATDYGIREIPLELLDYFVACSWRKLNYKDDIPTIAFLVASRWQRGLEQRP